MAIKTIAAFAANKSHTLLDTIRERFDLKNDAALANMPSVAPPVLSKIRGKTHPVGALLMIRAHEVFGMSIKEIKALAAS